MAPLNVSVGSRKESPLDLIIKGLNIAQAGFGIHTNYRVAQEAKQREALAVQEQAQKSKLYAEQESQSVRLQDPTTPESLNTMEAMKRSGFQVAPGTTAKQVQAFVSSPMWKGVEAREKAKLDRETELAKVSAGQKIPASNLIAQSEAQTSLKMLGTLEDSIKQSNDIQGPVAGRMASWNPYNTRAMALQGQTNATRQIIGKYLEGGVLRKEDEAKYAKILPVASDTPETALNKIGIVRNMIIAKPGSEEASLRGAGYNTRGLPRPNGGDLFPSANANDGPAKPDFTKLVQQMSLDEVQKELSKRNRGR